MFFNSELPTCTISVRNSLRHSEWAHFGKGDQTRSPPIALFNMFFTGLILGYWESHAKPTLILKEKNSPKGVWLYFSYSL